MSGGGGGTLYGGDAPSNGRGNGSLDHPPPTAAPIWRNPLICQLCNKPYQDACLLACYHSFCARCLKGRAKEAKLACPLCGKPTPLREGQSLPPPDNLLRFLVDATCDEFPPCANCDRNEKSPMFFCNTCVCWSSQRECDHLLNLINKETGLVLGEVTNLPMFYCNTCGQALCGPCRDATHRAKMFSQHEIIHMSKKTKELQKKCLYHNEPYAMFCTSKKSLLCMKCFRDTPLEARLHCLDLDTAYNQGVKKLDRALASIRDLQTSLRDGVVLIRALTEELRSNADRERTGINTVFNTVKEAIYSNYDTLLKELDSSYVTRDGHLQQQLGSLGVMLPTVHMHLTLCSSFTATANKFEFLSLAYQLIDRLTALAHMTLPVRPGHSSEINTHYKTVFLRSLEPITATLTETSPASSTAAATEKASTGGAVSFRPSRQQDSYGSSSLGHEPRGKRQVPSFRQLQAEKDFPKHCQIFESQMQNLNKRFGHIKDQVSDLHRDVTTRRCLTSYRRVESIVQECTTLKSEMEKTDVMMGEKRGLFNKVWEEEQQRIMAEQAIFKEQVK